MKISTTPHRSLLVPCGLKNFNYQIDPYIGCAHLCHYCYALNQAETDWSEEILVHKDIRGQLGDELAQIAPQTIYMGYHSDPYQPAETQFRQTRNALSLLLERGFSASILTKSDLVLRDIDLLEAMDNAAVSVSVAFNDEATRQRFEAGTVATGGRIAALRTLKKAGIKTGALICPVIPLVTDAIALLDKLATWADEIWVYKLSIMERADRNWQNINSILDTCYADQKERIESILFNEDHPYWRALRQTLNTLKREQSLNLHIHV